jgi:hypothetical protein
VAFASPDRLLICPNGTEDDAKQLFDAPLLNKRLDDDARDLLNQSGAAAIAVSPADVLKQTGFDETPVFSGTDEERQWLDQFVETARSADLAMVGMKYHEKVLELRARVLVDQAKSFSSLIDLSRKQQSWQAGLGLEPRNLVAALGIQLRAFPASAGPRAIPGVLLQNGSGLFSVDFLKGDMLRVLMELAGDSWNELDVARVGLYENDDTGLQGSYSMIGVVDSPEPSKVIDELRRLSAITSPMNTAERADRRDEEVQRLIRQLGSRDISLAARAETRLWLAGPAAVPSLRLAEQSSDPETRERAARTLKRIESVITARESQRVVNDPWFWTTLSPGLEWVESVDTIDRLPVHEVRVTPDSRKSAAEVQEAVNVMEKLFGPKWDEIRVVPVGDHFVFLIGSDRELLQTSVGNVIRGEDKLSGQFAGMGDCKKTGQLQGFLDTARLGRLAGRKSFQNYENPDNHVCWLMFDVGERSVSADALVPVEQIVPFLGGF